MRNESEAKGQVAGKEEQGVPESAGAARLEPRLKEKSKPRLKPINRQQMLLRAVEVGQLVAEDHEARAIWELVGQLDLSPYYQQIRAVEGVAGVSP